MSGRDQTRFKWQSLSTSKQSLSDNSWRRSPQAIPASEHRELLKKIEAESFRDYPFAALYSCGPHWVLLKMAIEDDRLELVGLDVRAFPSRSGTVPITTAALRRLPLSAIIEDAATRIEKEQGGFPRAVRPIGVKVAGRYSDRDLEEVARAYLHAGSIGPGQRSR